MSDEPTFFPTPRDFRRWLTENHTTSGVLWVGFYKVGTGKPSVTWDQAVDEALCFGWIDGVRRRIDEERYKIRFTPRRPRSIWSQKNVASVERLIRDSRMKPSGMKAFEARTEDRSGVYSFEQGGVARFTAPLLKTFEANAEAWSFFNDQPAGYQKTLRHWVMSAKRDTTRMKRLERLIEVSARGKRVDLLSPFKREA